MIVLVTVPPPDIYSPPPTKSECESSITQSVIVARDPPSIDTPPPALVENPRVKTSPSSTTSVELPEDTKHLSRSCPNTVTVPPPALRSARSFPITLRFSAYNPGWIRISSPLAAFAIAAVIVM